MGWTGLHKQKGQPLKEFFQHEFNYENEKVKGTLLECKSFPYKRESYIAYEHITKESGVRVVIGIVVIYHMNPRAWENFTYKDMEEGCGPGYCNCPQSILELLTPTDSKYANDWRKGCWEKIKNKQSYAKGSYIRNKDRVMKITHGRKHYAEKKEGGLVHFYPNNYIVINPKKDALEDLMLCMGYHPDLDADIETRLKKENKK